jgi:arylmalonate decarboxylase
MKFTQQAGKATASIGLVVPTMSAAEPLDAKRMYPDVRFLTKGLAYGTLDDDRRLVEQVVGTARSLADEGVSAISLMGSSLSFYRDAEFTRELKKEMEHASGVPCTTMSDGILRAMAALEMSRVLVVTAYSGVINTRLAHFLKENNIDVVNAREMKLSRVGGMTYVSTETLVQQCLGAWRETKSADSILLACGGLITLDTITRVERKLGVPVVSSAAAGSWDVVGAAGLNRRFCGLGRLGQIS